MLDTAAGVWLDKNGLVTSPKTSKGHTESDPALELMRRCRHASASVGVRIYVYGGLRGENETVDKKALKSNSYIGIDLIRIRDPKQEDLT